MRVEVNPLALKPCPESKTGVHYWILHASNWCRAEGMSDAEAAEFIRELMTRNPSPRNEVEAAVAKVYDEPEREPGEPYVQPRVFPSLTLSVGQQ